MTKIYSSPTPSLSLTHPVTPVTEKNNQDKTSITKLCDDLLSLIIANLKSEDIKNFTSTNKEYRNYFRKNVTRRVLISSENLDLIETKESHPLVKQATLTGSLNPASIPKLADTFPNIDYLYLNKINLTDSQIQEFGKFFPNLKKISFSCKDISENGLNHLSSLKHLESLHLGCFSKPHGLDFVNHLTQLKEIKITAQVAANSLNNSDLENLKNVKKLENLYLHNHSLLTPDSLDTLKTLSNLKTLCVTFCGTLTNGLNEQLLSDLKNHFPNAKITFLK